MPKGNNECKFKCGRLAQSTHETINNAACKWKVISNSTVWRSYNKRETQWSCYKSLPRSTKTSKQKEMNKKKVEINIVCSQKQLTVQMFQDYIPSIWLQKLILPVVVLVSSKRSMEGPNTWRQHKIIESANKSLNIYTIEKNPKDSDLIYPCLTLTHGIFTLHKY